MIVSGRLVSAPDMSYDERHPIILPYNCQLSRQFAIYRCKVCVLHKQKVEEQLMGILPAERTTLCRPFSHTGVDLLDHLLSPISVRVVVESQKTTLACAYVSQRKPSI